MSVAPRPPSAEPALEVLGFRAVPGGPGVAVLHLEGRFAARAPRSLGHPELVVEDRDGDAHEAVAVAGGEALAGPDPPAWRASFAVPRAALHGGRFALAVGRRLLLDLPAPHIEQEADPGAGQHVRLAREANRLRRRAEEARAALEAEREKRADAERALDRARRELAEREEALAAERARAAAAGHELRAARAELEALRRERPARAPDPETEEHEQDAEGAPLAGPAPAGGDGNGNGNGNGGADGEDPTTETVRVLTPRARRPRLDLEAEAAHANDTRPQPGAARIGAEHIERAGHHGRVGDRTPSSTTRAIAVAAIALFALVLALVVLGLGPV